MKRKIDYFHHNPQPEKYHTLFHNHRYTIAVVLPTKQELLNMVTVDFHNQIQMEVGGSFLHPKDNYIKKIGIATAKSRLGSSICYLKEISYVEDGKWIYTFRTVLPDPTPSRKAFKEIEFGISVCKNSNRTMLLYALGQDG